MELVKNIAAEEPEIRLVVRKLVASLSRRAPVTNRNLAGGESATPNLEYTCFKDAAYVSAVMLAVMLAVM